MATITGWLRDQMPQVGNDFDPLAPQPGLRGAAQSAEPPIMLADAGAGAGSIPNALGQQFMKSGDTKLLENWNNGQGAPQVSPGAAPATPVRSKPINLRGNPLTTPSAGSTGEAVLDASKSNFFR